MNPSGVPFSGQQRVINETDDIQIMPIPQSPALTARMRFPLHVEGSNRGMAGNNVAVHVTSISPEKAKQIKEEVLQMQKNRFKSTSPRKRRSSAPVNSKSHSDLKNKTPPKKYFKTSVNITSPKNLPDNRTLNLDPNTEVVPLSKTIPGSKRMSVTCSNGEDKYVKKTNLEKNLNDKNSVMKSCFSRNMPTHSSSDKHFNKDSIVTNSDTPSVSKNVIFVDLTDDDDEFQKAENKPFIAEDKACKVNNKLNLRKEPHIAPEKVQKLNEKASKYFNHKVVMEGPLNLSVKSNIPYDGKGQIVQPSSSSGNVLPECPKKAKICSVSKKLPACTSKSQCNQLCVTSTTGECNDTASGNKLAGCSNYNSGSAVMSSVLTKESNTHEEKQHKPQAKEVTLPECSSNDAIKLSQSISQQPKKFAVNTRNGFELVMAAGGSGKKKSPRNRLGKNSPIKVLRSPYLKKIKPFQANTQKVRKSLNFEESEQKAPAGAPLPYVENYVQHFVKIIMEVLDNELNKKLFRDELGTIQTFATLEEQSKRLFIRMLGRKLKWHRVNEIKYEEIPSVDEAFVKLELAGFVTSDFKDENLETMLNLLKVQELRELCKRFRIKATGNKPILIQSLMDYGKNQMSVGTHSTTTVLWKSIRDQLGYCIKLSSIHRDAIQRLLTLFSITHQDNAADRELSRLLSLKHFVESNRIAYPSYKILRTRSVFASREDMLGYEAAEKLLKDLLERTDLKDWEAVCLLGKEAQKCLIELLQDKERSETASTLPLFLRRYCPGSVYAYAITQAVEGFRKNKATIQDAVIALRELLSQHIYLPYYRGRWYDTLALLLHSHLHKAKEAAELIIEALNEDAINEEFQHNLSIRGSRLLKVLKGNCAELKVKLQCLLKPSLDDIPEVTIKAKALGSNLPGYKKVYIEEGTGETTYSSVEELVISRYKKEFPEAIHGEGSTMRTLFGLLFWNVIYSEEVPDVFQSPYQVEPLDLSSGEFYMNRKEAIDMRLHDLSGWGFEELQWIVKDIYKQHEGKTSVVNWNRFRNVNQVMNVIKCIGVKVLCRILERFAKHYRHVRKGFPDVILWAPARNECLFVEVKGPKDRLSVCQKIWLNKLIEFGARAEVCHVQTTGSKKLKRKTSGASSEDNRGNPCNKEADNRSICIELSE